MSPVDSLTMFLAVRPQTRARLLAQHRPDDRRRCRGCRTPGYGTPGADWPCVIAAAARAADQQAVEHHHAADIAARAAGRTTEQPEPRP